MFTPMFSSRGTHDRADVLCGGAVTTPISSADGQAAVLHDGDALGAAGHGAVVGDDDEAQAEFAPQALEQRGDLVSGLLVQIAGGLVGQEYPGLLDWGAGAGHRLLLAAG
jgi:hypothetical protein